MNLVGMIGTAVLSLTLIAAAPVFAQEQHDQQEEQKDKPEEKAQPEKSAKPAEKPAAQDEKSAKPEEKNAKQQATTKPEEKNAQPERQPAGNNGGRIPAAKYQANFGRQHTFHVSQGDYSNRRFQYGGYTFGFAGAWPSNWLYTQDVYVVDINGVYYLCNPSYPGVNIELSFTL